MISGLLGIVSQGPMPAIAQGPRNLAGDPVVPDGGWTGGGGGQQTHEGGQPDDVRYAVDKLHEEIRYRIKGNGNGLDKIKAGGSSGQQKNSPADGEIDVVLTARDVSELNAVTFTSSVDGATLTVTSIKSKGPVPKMDKGNLKISATIETMDAG